MTPERLAFLRRMFGKDDPVIVELLDALEAAEKRVLGPTNIASRIEEVINLLNGLPVEDENGNVIGRSDPLISSAMAIELLNMPRTSDHEPVMQRPKCNNNNKNGEFCSLPLGHNGWHGCNYGDERHSWPPIYTPGSQECNAIWGETSCEKSAGHQDNHQAYGGLPEGAEWTHEAGKPHTPEPDMCTNCGHGLGKHVRNGSGSMCIGCLCAGWSGHVADVGYVMGPVPHTPERAEKKCECYDHTLCRKYQQSLSDERDWVIKERDEWKTKFKGHEHLLSIIMEHLKDVDFGGTNEVEGVYWLTRKYLKSTKKIVELEDLIKQYKSLYGDM